MKTSGFSLRVRSRDGMAVGASFVLSWPPSGRRWTLETHGFDDRHQRPLRVDNGRSLISKADTHCMSAFGERLRQEPATLRHSVAKTQRPKAAIWSATTSGWAAAEGTNLRSTRARSSCCTAVRSSGVSVPASAKWTCPSSSVATTPSITQQWKWTWTRSATVSTCRRSSGQLRRSARVPARASGLLRPGRSAIGAAWAPERRALRALRRGLASTLRTGGRGL